MWLPSDVATALAYERLLVVEKASTCPDCGTRHTDWVDEETGRELTVPPWVPEVVDCPGCRHVSRARDGLRDLPDSVGKHVILRRPDLDSDEEEVDPDGLYAMRHGDGRDGVTTLEEFPSRATEGWLLVWDGEHPRRADASDPDPPG